MIFINGNKYNTITDAAHRFGVSAKTLRTYIEKAIIPEPPEVSYGVRILKYFPDEYLSKAKKNLDDYRKTKKLKKQ
jgi:hypothetical protein